MPISITNMNYKTEVLDSKQAVIMDVFALWCGPCQHMKPVFEAVEKELGATYKFVTLNVEEDRDLSAELGVSSIPSFLFFQNGKLLAKEVGVFGQEALKELIKNHFS
jgi:thioredoxin 1